MSITAGVHAAIRAYEVETARRPVAIGIPYDDFLILLTEVESRHAEQRSLENGWRALVIDGVIVKPVPT